MTPVVTPAPGSAGVSSVSAFLSDARLALTVLNELRCLALRRAFGVPREQANLLTFVLALGAAEATYDVARRFLRHPWPLDGTDTAITAFLVRESGFGIAGPQARAVQLGGILIVAAAAGSLTLPGLRRAVHSLHAAEQRVGEQRRRIYGAAQQQARNVAEQRRTARPA
jgi:hypothetical protein